MIPGSFLWNFCPLMSIFPAQRYVTDLESLCFATPSRFTCEAMRSALRDLEINPSLREHGSRLVFVKPLSCVTCYALPFILMLAFLTHLFHLFPLGIGQYLLDLVAYFAALND